MEKLQGVLVRKLYAYNKEHETKEHIFQSILETWDGTEKPMLIKLKC